MTTLQMDRTKSGGQPKLQVKEHNPLPPWTASTDLAVVGQPHARIEGAEKVTGRAQYTYDVRLPGQLSAKVLRSRFPHATITRVDTSRAEALEGVLAVLCVENAPDIDWYQDGKLFNRTVHFVGDEVAAVAAISEEIADDALKLIEVEYEQHPFVTDLAAALAPDAPKARSEGNLAGEPKVEQRGDTDAGLREADVVVDQVYETQTALHNCLESHGSTASWEGDTLTLWDSTQSIWTVRNQVAQKLGLPEHHVRVIKQYMGGGFGSKQIPWKNTVLAALLSRQSGRPVQLMLDREAENLAAGNRNPTRQRVRLGAKRDGTLTAIDTHIDQTVGAYQAGGEASNVSGIYHTLYKCPNVRTEQVLVYTNTGPAVAFRAPGHVEGAFALEAAMDELARKLDLDPIELRLRNYANEDQQQEKPYTLPEGLRLCYERASEAFGWRDYRKPAPDGSKRRGIGFAAHDWVGGGGWPPGYAWIKLNPDGTADVVTGTQDIGTGTRTGLAQIAAEELGLPLESVSLQLGDTAYGPYSPVSSGSATQATIGPAIRAAAADVKQKLLEAAATLLEVSADRLSIHDGTIHVDGKSDGRAVPVSKVTGAMAPHMLIGEGARGPNPSDKAPRTFGAQCVEVEVDLETGEVSVLRLAAAHDCGRIVNPTMVHSQVIGAVTQGVGFALTEERIVDDRLGVVLNANLEEYLVPTIADVPPVDFAGPGVPDPESNSTGAKGIGEPPLIPTAPAIANAVFDATGIRIRQAPLTRAKLLGALTGAVHGERKDTTS